MKALYQRVVQSIARNYLPEQYLNIALWKGQYVTGFWKTDHFVTFDIIYISVYLRHSRWYYWFNKWLNQSHTT